MGLLFVNEMAVYEMHLPFVDEEDHTRVNTGSIMDNQLGPRPQGYNINCFVSGCAADSASADQALIWSLYY